MDAEFSMSLQSDDWQAENLMMQLSNKDSSMCRFLCGNAETLSQPGIRESLLAFHKKWYSSNIIALSVIGRFSIE